MKTIFYFFIVLAIVSVHASRLERTVQVNKHVTINQEAKFSTLNSSERLPGSHYQGLLVICEGKLPEARMFTSPVNNMIYYVDKRTTCDLTDVYGSKRGSNTAYLNHATLWDGKFRGMNYFYEEHYDCIGGSLKIQRRISATETTVFECDSGYEAHVVHWLI